MKLLISLFLITFTSTVFANDLENILKDANRYTVKIYNSTDTPFIEDDYYTSVGSGFLIDKQNGIIITNAHVGSYSPSLNRVNFKYHDPVQAKQVYIDKDIDLELLQIDPKTIPSDAVEAKLHCKNDYNSGQGVVAFGHPANKDFTITRGIISAIRYENNFFESIQTDAAINHGNSGGPLIDISTGEVIGISSFGVVDNQGLNFALPSYTVCKVIELYKQKKDPSPLNFNVIFATNHEQGRFLKVSDILNPKENLLKVGDEILEIDNVKVKNPTQLNTESRGKTNITLKILRDNKQQELKLSLKSLGSVTTREGLVFSNVIVSDKASASRLPLSQRMLDPKFNLVVQNLKSGPASGKLRRYDVIEYVDGKEFKSVHALYDYLKDKKEIEIVFRRISSDEEKRFVYSDYHDKIDVKDVKFLKFE